MLINSGAKVLLFFDIAMLFVDFLLVGRAFSLFALSADK